ncbi:hypothetical protein L1887_23772 [Cichorium endivia]|nr:hypothetical protein L1887_23772 [Cichorium endivia]
MSYRGKKVKVNIAKYRREDVTGGLKMPLQNYTTRNHTYTSNKTDGRTFLEVQSGKCGNTQEAIPLVSIEGNKNWLRNTTLVGEMRNLESLINLPRCGLMQEYNEMEIKYLGGLRKLEWGETSTNQFDRIDWLKIIGIPVNAWGDENFEKVAAAFGEVLTMEEHIWNRYDLAFGKVGVLTTSTNYINKEIQVIIEGKNCKIRVTEVDLELDPFRIAMEESLKEKDEEDWSEDSEFDDDEDDDEDDGISETWMQEMYDMEEGEFFPENMAAPVTPGDESPMAEERKLNSSSMLGDGPSNKKTEVEETLYGEGRIDVEVNSGGGFEHGLPGHSRDLVLMGHINIEFSNNEHYGREHVPAQQEPIIDLLECEFEWGNTNVKRR